MIAFDVFKAVVDDSGEKVGIAAMAHVAETLMPLGFSPHFDYYAKRRSLNVTPFLKSATVPMRRILAHVPL